jgi:hypothetical protein
MKPWETATLTHLAALTELAVAAGVRVVIMQGGQHTVPVAVVHILQIAASGGNEIFHDC